MKRKLAVGAVLSSSAVLAGAIQVGAGSAHAAPAPVAAARALGLSGQEQLIVKDTITDPDGTRHVRYERTFAGLPILGGDLIVHQSAQGAIRSADRAVAGRVAPASLAPKLDAVQAASKAHDAVAATVGVPEGDEPALVSVDRPGTAQLVVWAASGTPRLAHRTTVEGVRADGTPSSQVVVTDAATGEVLSTHEQVQTANA
ncbi:peptidase M4 family protein, partial [Kitasatospora sp. NPDC007106]